MTEAEKTVTTKTFKLCSTSSILPIAGKIFLFSVYLNEKTVGRNLVGHILFKMLVHIL